MGTVRGQTDQERIKLAPAWREKTSKGGAGAGEEAEPSETEVQGQERDKGTPGSGLLEAKEENAPHRRMWSAVPMMLENPVTRGRALRSRDRETVVTAAGSPAWWTVWAPRGGGAEAVCPHHGGALSENNRKTMIKPTPLGGTGGGGQISLAGLWGD